MRPYIRILTCKWCHKEFRIPSSQRPRMYCSDKCRNAGHSKRVTEWQKNVTPEQRALENQRRRDTIFKRYGCTCVQDIPGVQEKRRQSRYKISSASAERLPKDIVDTVTESVIIHIIELLGVPFQTHYVIDDVDFTIYIPDKKLVIRVDSAINDHMFRTPGAMYHLNMTRVAEAAGLRCIHVFDWDSVEKIYMMLLPKTRIPARKCIIEELDKDTCNIFLNMYHLQGPCQAQTVRYGLYYNNELVEVMTFGKSRFAKKFEWELIRMCSDADHIVVGGSSKLFKHFIQTYNPASIISYCDTSKFTGGVYLNMGMKFHQSVYPSKVWSRGSKRITDRLLCMAGYDELFNAHNGKGTSNEDLMVQNDWLPVYDCGQKSYSWYRESEDTIL